MARRILILGEHDKGHGEPFAIKTLSGRRLRKLIDCIGLKADLGNVFRYTEGGLEPRCLDTVCKGYGTVVALGRVAAAECARQGVPHTYLPHPAVRAMAKLRELEEGLRSLAKP